MKINSIPQKDMYYKYVHVRRGGATTGASGTHTDRVELTSDARTFAATLKNARAALDGSSGTPQGRLDELREQIANQSYSISGEDVAAKILGRR